MSENYKARYDEIVDYFSSIGVTVTPQAPTPLRGFNEAYTFELRTDFGVFSLIGGDRLESKCPKCGGGSRWMERQLECGGCGLILGSRETGVNGYHHAIPAVKENLGNLITERLGCSPYETLITVNMFWQGVSDLSKLWRDMNS